MTKAASDAGNFILGSRAAFALMTELGMILSF